MPELTFKIAGVEPIARGLAPLLGFNLEVTNKPANQLIHSILLTAQIQFQCPQRNYSAKEKENLVELFGPPEMWGQSLRNRIWTQSHATICAFREHTQAVLDVPCTFDLNITATKYIYALDEGDLQLLFLFSGSVFYESEEGLKVEPISWDQECAYQMRVGVWKDLMQHHYPNTSWFYLQRDVFDRLYAFKRQGAFLNWEQAIESLLDEAEQRLATEHSRCLEVLA